MEFEVEKEKEGFLKKLLKLRLVYKILLILSVPVIAYLVSNGISPVQKIRGLENLTENDSIFQESYDSSCNSVALTEIIREKAFKEALVRLAENDSINLIIDLNDSILYLSINGVLIHQNKIELKKVDPIFSALSNKTYLKIFSEPLPVLEEFSTIVKEPIVERQAPKDTLEAALNAYKPDTLIQNPAFLQMKLNHDINLIFEQDKNTTGIDKITYFKFRLKLYTHQACENIRNFVTFKKQEYKPTVIIKLPVNELRSAYRALPEKAKVVLHF